MIPALSIHNLVFWAAQVALIVGVGMVCPTLFRVRHPRSQLTYCYVLLVICLALPFIPQWRSGQLTIRNASPTGRLSLDRLTLDSIESWAPLVLSIVAAGVLVRLLLFGVGMLRICYYRRTAIPYRFPKHSVLSACKVTHADLFVGICANEVGPVTMGWLRPTVLLPASFLSLEEDAQHAILCHELLHVTRNDWIVTLIEELIGALLWFHPAVWWLLKRIRVIREQVIDSEIVQLPSAKDPYIDALLEMAAVHPERTAQPAPLFAHSRQLSERLRLLLDSRVTSRRRVALSYSLMSVIIIAAGWVGLRSFPLMAYPKSQSAGSPAAGKASDLPAVTMYIAGDGATSPRLIAGVEPQYSDTARFAHIEGSVVLEGIVGVDGRMTVKRILRRLHPDLDRNAARAIGEWRFEPSSVHAGPLPITLLIEVTFKLR